MEMISVYDPPSVTLWVTPPGSPVDSHYSFVFSWKGRASLPVRDDFCRECCDVGSHGNMYA